MSMPVQEKEALAAVAVLAAPVVVAVGIAFGMAVERWVQRQYRKAIALAAAAAL